MADVRFMYLRDPRCPERVLTIARFLKGDVLYVTWCINRVRYAQTQVKKGHGRPSARQTTVIVDEPFDKRKARCICIGRINIGKVIPVSVTEKSNRHLLAQMFDAIREYRNEDYLVLPEVRTVIDACTHAQEQAEAEAARKERRRLRKKNAPPPTDSSTTIN